MKAEELREIAERYASQLTYHCGYEVKVQTFEAALAEVARHTRQECAEIVQRELCDDRGMSMDRISLSTKLTAAIQEGM